MTEVINYKSSHKKGIFFISYNVGKELRKNTKTKKIILGNKS